jgi:hypothetical protein
VGEGPHENPPTNSQQLCLSCQYASSEGDHERVLVPLCRHGRLGDYGATIFTVNAVDVGSPVFGVPFTETI